MKLAYAIPADAAQITSDGKVSMLGGDFEIIYAPKFPALPSNISLLVRLDVERSECEQEHQLRIELIGPQDTNVIPPVESAFTPHLNNDDLDRPVRFIFIISVGMIPLEKPGKYEFRFLVDGLAVGKIPLFAVRSDARSPSGDLAQALEQEKDEEQHAE